MDRRTFLALLASPAVLAALQACGSDSKGSSVTANSTSPTGSPSGRPGEVAQSALARSASCVCDAGAAATAVNDFGVDLYRALAGDSPGGANLVCSPASIAIALAMTRAGAAGTTATEMDTALHVADPAQLAASMNAMTAGLAARNLTIDVPGGDPVTLQLSIANSLWAQFDMAIKAAFLDVLASEYGAGVRLVDYRSDADGARQLINAWVSDETEQRIPELLAEGVITPDARLTLVNAIYMKAPWLNTFSPEATAPAPFTTLDGSVVQAEMMHQTDHFGYAEGDGWRALELPYHGELLNMIVVLPEEGRQLVDVIDAFGTLTSPLDSSRVVVSFPKFDTESKFSLSDVLRALGMPAAFDRSAADFSGITDDTELFIADVIHQANITVDEHGTEAAAATAVVMETTAAPAEDPVQFIVDRPFLFAIRDVPTGATLFLGHIGDPTV